MADPATSATGSLHFSVITKTLAILLRRKGNKLVNKYPSPVPKMSLPTDLLDPVGSPISVTAQGWQEIGQLPQGLTNNTCRWKGHGLIL